jgi:hypothetical protein
MRLGVIAPRFERVDIFSVAFDFLRIDLKQTV